MLTPWIKVETAYAYKLINPSIRLKEEVRSTPECSKYYYYLGQPE